MSGRSSCPAQARSRERRTHPRNRPPGNTHETDVPQPPCPTADRTAFPMAAGLRTYQAPSREAERQPFRLAPQSSAPHPLPRALWPRLANGMRCRSHQPCGTQRGTPSPAIAMIPHYTRGRQSVHRGPPAFSPEGSARVAKHPQKRSITALLRSRPRPTSSDHCQTLWLLGRPSAELPHCHSVPPLRGRLLLNYLYRILRRLPPQSLKSEP